VSCSAKGGCRSNGTCGTGSCNKLNVYDWLTNMSLPSGQKLFDVVEVRFKGTRKEFFRNKEGVELHNGDVVAVESSPGHDVGVVSLTGELVRFQLKKKGLDDSSDQIKVLYRKAKPNEVDKWIEVRDKEKPMLSRAREIIKGLTLEMKLSDVEYQGDGKKATFYYTADERVDFRELIKRLAGEFHIRIEMKQIGLRQEAGRLGGIGSCGRELCCATWLTDFRGVTTSSARYQNLALNPAKLAGQCGKLKCCLNYELDSYLDALKNIPDDSIALFTEKGKATHRKTDIFKGMMWYAYSDDVKEMSTAMEGGVEGSWIPLPVDRVKEIIALNQESKKPADLSEYQQREVKVASPDYGNVVGQDRIDRMDKNKNKNKNKNRRNKNRKPDNKDQQAQQGDKPPQGNKPHQQNRPQQGGKHPQKGNRPPQQGQSPPRDEKK
jgi:cell fate regulator YaaT (PSP1 superfamily)